MFVDGGGGGGGGNSIAIASLISRWQWWSALEAVDQALKQLRGDGYNGDGRHERYNWWI